LQLLFYLLIPSKTLVKFLSTHPAGGVPFWLLEVDSDIVFSLASMSHYHYYGHTFLPANLQRPTTPFVYPTSNEHLRLKMSANAAQDFIFWLIKPPPSSNQSLDNMNGIHSANNVASPTRKIPANRRASNSKGNGADDAANSNGDVIYNNSMHGKTEVMKKLEEISEGRQVSTLTKEMEDPRMEESRLRFRMAAQPMNGSTVYWSMEDFALWADQALDDLALDSIMHRLFATGILPTYALEKELVQQRWLEWQSSARDHFFQSPATKEEDSTVRELTMSARKLLESYQNGPGTSSLITTNGSRKGHDPNVIWGGLGGFDGKAAMGYGIMYCIDKSWWNSWEAYAGWSYIGQVPKERSDVRPRQLSTVCLVDRDPDSEIGGLLGSYEVMRQGLERDVDYVLIPHRVWDILYELYGGGPPLPRPVLTPAVANQTTDINTNTFETTINKSADNDNGNETPFDELRSSPSSSNLNEIYPIPQSLNVALHPWIIHAHLCDPLQPYRRGDVGPLSIRVMACPEQPLWRLFAEIVVRLPLRSLKAYGSDGRGKARLWKKNQPTGIKDPNTRFGPWSLICKNRFAKLPALNYTAELEENFDELQQDWEAYADKASLEGATLTDGDELMLECAIYKNNEFVWPREAAAKAGKVRRLATEDAKFRQLLRGVDENGNAIENPPKLVGLVVDAMDNGGRWYQVEILKVETVAVETEGDEVAPGEGDQDESKQVKVDFSEFGGHIEWIDTESDRLATAGRFTQGRTDDTPTKTPPSNTNGNTQDSKDSKAKPAVTAKKSTADSYENGKVCLFPGYGACGLTNLGNTCYVNSAAQCISYMPLIRSYLLSSQYKTTGDLNKENLFGTGGKLLEEFAELLRIMWSARYGEKSPSKFRVLLGKCNTDFSGADQQDAQEFLNFILDKIHEDCCRVLKKPAVPALEDDWVKATSLPRVEKEAWRRCVQ